MMLRPDMHKRWSEAYLRKELKKRLDYPPDRPDIAEFDRTIVRRIEDYAVGARELFPSLDSRGWRLLREGAMASLDDGHPDQHALALGVLYTLRQEQWLRARNTVWLTGGPSIRGRDTLKSSTLTLASCVAVGWLGVVKPLLGLVLRDLVLGAFYDASLNWPAKAPPYRRCFTWFTARLLADWTGLPLPTKLPVHPYPAPAYDALLACWRHADPQVLVEPLLATCDWHTHESIYSRSDAPHKDVDFISDPYMGWPIEVHMVYRLREDLGLKLPQALDHPMMATGLAPFLPTWPVPHDDLLDRAMVRAVRDWPPLAALVNTPLIAQVPAS